MYKCALALVVADPEIRERRFGFGSVFAARHRPARGGFVVCARFARAVPVPSPSQNARPFAS